MGVIELRENPAQERKRMEVTRDQFFGMAGIRGIDGAYTPVSLGKSNAIRNGNYAWIKSLRKLNYTNADELRNQTPETVTSNPVVIPIVKTDDLGNQYIDNTPQKHYQAIVGENTKNVYSIKTDRYNIVQHKDVVEAFAEASDVTGIKVFGTLSDVDGRMNINAFFADPDCNIDLAGGSKDPVMLGVRCYNSHNGTTGFGGRIMGVRYLCSNMMSFGDVLGSVHWKHYTKMGDVTSQFSNLITSYMKKVPVLQDKIARMQDDVLTLDEAECLLWGIKVHPKKIDAIMDNMDALNPEIRHKNGKVSVFDVYNSANAYVTYYNGGGRDEYKHNQIDSIENMITTSSDKLYDIGSERRTAYLEKVKTLDLTGAVLVND